MKNLKYMLFLFLISFVSITQVYAIDYEQPCQGSIQGVFTALGWVFWIVKIAVPILLIIFGTIDVGKTLLSGKPEDDFKKAIKGLVMKAIAGIIIFFIPTILTLIVNLIDDDSIYNKETGTFADCTRCMLDPMDSCDSIGGE